MLGFIWGFMSYWEFEITEFVGDFVIKVVEGKSQNLNFMYVTGWR
jgi:hypothetical protein